MSHKERCACGCPPKAGTLVMLWWTMIWSVVGMFFVNYGYRYEIIYERIGRQLDMIFVNDFYRSFIINTLITVLVICVVGLYGVYTKNSRFLIAYIVYRIVVDVLVVFGLFPLLLDMYLNATKYGDLLVRLLSKYALAKDNAQDSFDHVFISFILLEFAFIAVEAHFIKVIVSCCDLMESSARMCKNEIMFLSNLKGSSPNGKFYFTSDKEISTAV